ncbi:hypothetical protein CHH53_16070 [Terribacillus sp. 7520-G]|nr:hypothetical protein CHH53_16070 [Terribacillus sp. 7520-G]
MGEEFRNEVHFLMQGFIAYIAKKKFLPRLYILLRQKREFLPACKKSTSRMLTFPSLTCFAWCLYRIP